EPFQVPPPPQAPVPAWGSGVDGERASVRAFRPAPATPLPQGERDGNTLATALTPVVAQSLTAHEAYTLAHGAYLRFNETLNRIVTGNITFQTALLEKVVRTPIAMPQA